MLVNRPSPFDLLDEMHRSFSLLDEMNGEYRPTYARTQFPPLNGWSDAENFYLEAELPGFSVDDLDITLTKGRILTIHGERRLEETERPRNWIRRERGYGSFERHLELPAAVQEDQIEAEFKDGVLLIIVPKAKECRPRRIAVAKG